MACWWRARQLGVSGRRLDDGYGQTRAVAPLPLAVAADGWYTAPVVTQHVAFLFPGQGAQTVGMGLDFYESSRAARDIFDRADSLLGFSLSKICFEGPSEELTRTEVCQPAILTTSIAALEAARSVIQDRWVPKAVAGLSLGEYTALVAAGALAFEDGLKLVWARGKFMEAAAKQQPGTMATVLGLSAEAVQEACREAGAEVANLNSQEQIVISGRKEAVAKARS